MFSLKIGDIAPTFSAMNQKGELITNNVLKGKKYLLYFYPKDNTPGCTAQACNLRDNIELFQKENILIFGISADNEKSHIRFIEKFNLPFDLLIDEDNKMAKTFDIYGEKKFMSRVYDGVHRTSFLINKKGIIEKIIRKVETKNHASQLFGIQ